MLAAPRNFADVLGQGSDHLIPVVDEAHLNKLSDVICNILALGDGHIQSVFFELSGQPRLII